MKTLVTVLYNDWDPNLPQEIDPALFDLSQEKALLAIVLMLANGIVAEACFDAETTDGLALIRGLLQGTGGASPLPDASMAHAARLYRTDYDVFLQSTDVFLFVARQARPELFRSTDYATYIAEFNEP
jgi:hypothetical protein